MNGGSSQKFGGGGGIISISYQSGFVDKAGLTAYGGSGGVRGGAAGPITLTQGDKYTAYTQVIILPYEFAWSVCFSLNIVIA